MPIVPTLHTLLTPVLTQWHAQCLGIKIHSGGNINLFQCLIEYEPIRTGKDPGNKLIQCSLLTYE